MDENKVDFEKMTPAERLKYEVAEEIGLADNPYHGGDFPIQVAKRNEVSEMICF